MIRILKVVCSAWRLARAARLVARAHLLFRLQAEFPQIGEHAAKDPQLVVRREAAELQHHARVKRSHVAVPDIPRDAGEEDIRIAALEGAGLRQIGDRMAPAVIFAQEERIDLRRIAAHDGILVIVGENLRLHEVAGAQRLGKGADLLHHGPCWDVQMRGHLRQAVALQGPRADVVDLREQVSIDEMPPVDFVFRDS